VKPNWNRLQNAGSEILEFVVDSRYERVVYPYAPTTWFSATRAITGSRVAARSTDSEHRRFTNGEILVNNRQHFAAIMSFHAIEKI
jgi:hypothetical protein